MVTALPLESRTAAARPSDTLSAADRARSANGSPEKCDVPEVWLSRAVAEADRTGAACKQARRFRGQKWAKTGRSHLWEALSRVIYSVLRPLHPTLKHELDTSLLD